MTLPKYSQLEHERRFIVAPARCPNLDPSGAILIEDRYLNGGRLRLRSNTSANGTKIFKLAKKYPGDVSMSRPMTNLYLDVAEFELISGLPNRRVCKRRYQVGGGFIVDVFVDALDGLILAEIEADAATVCAVSMPEWTAAEITADPRYDGGTLSRWTTDDLAAHRSLYG